MTDDQKQLLREATMDLLAASFPAALPPNGILRRLRTEVDFLPTIDGVSASLHFLAGMTPPRVERMDDVYGAGEHWRATPEGVIAVERGNKTVRSE